MIEQTINESRSRVSDLQTESGMPLLESLVLLKTVKSVGGVIAKRDLTYTARTALGFDYTYETQFLKYIDNLVKIGLIVRYDFKYQLTPAGERHLSETNARVLPALRTLVFR